MLVTQLKWIIKTLWIMMNGSPGMDVDGSGTVDLEEWLLGNRKTARDRDHRDHGTKLLKSDLAISENQIGKTWENAKKIITLSYAIQLPDYSVFTLCSHVFLRLVKRHVLTCSKACAAWSPKSCTRRRRAGGAADVGSWEPSMRILGGCSVSNVT